MLLSPRENVVCCLVFQPCVVLMTPPFWVKSIVFFFIVVTFPYLMFVVVSLGRGVKLSFIPLVVLFILPFVGGFSPPVIPGVAST